MTTDPLIQQCESVAGLLKELAHGQRLQMLCHLVSKERSVTELTALCSTSQSRVSQFLAQMRKDGLVSARRDGKFVFYRIEDARIARLIRSLRTIFCP
jgi:DNA-binding transcriptional ArsR family regulator